MKTTTPGQKVKLDADLYETTVRGHLTQQLSDANIAYGGKWSSGEAALLEKNVPQVINAAVEMAMLEFKKQNPRSGISQMDITLSKQALRHTIRESWDLRARDEKISPPTLNGITTKMYQKIDDEITKVSKDFLGQGIA